MNIIKISNGRDVTMARSLSLVLQNTLNEFQQEGSQAKAV